jgi:hypothetical protein
MRGITLGVTGQVQSVPRVSNWKLTVRVQPLAPSGTSSGEGSIDL